MTQAYTVDMLTTIRALIWLMGAVAVAAAFVVAMALSMAFVGGYALYEFITAFTRKRA